MLNDCETQTNVNFHIMTQCLVMNARLNERISDQCRSSKLDEQLIRIIA